VQASEDVVVGRRVRVKEGARFTRHTSIQMEAGLGSEIWSEYLTQRKVSVVVDDDDDETPISETNQVRTQRIGKKLSYLLDSINQLGTTTFC
jgi:hypothetical protein